MILRKKTRKVCLPNLEKNRKRDEAKREIFESRREARRNKR